MDPYTGKPGFRRVGSDSVDAVGGRRCAIKDTLHGYIQLTELETALVDSLWFQRLRRIKQNDVTSTVYPTVQTTRFEHSLGALHLSRDCMRAALDNTPDSIAVRDFLEALASEVAGHTDGKALTSLDSAVLAEDLAALCGLLHDIGHPPLSHLMEQCLPYTSIYPGGPSSAKWHETNGLKLIRECLGHLPALSNEADRALVLIAADIMDEGCSTGPALSAIGSLVNSVIDTDRMDFVMRDGRASGSDFGHYDVQRIVQSFQILVDQATQSILIRPSAKALSAVEALLQERYKVYRWVHFHHRVMLAKAYVRYALREIQEGVVSGVRFDATAFQALRYCNESGEPLFLDDGYAWSILERALTALEGNSSRTFRQDRLRTVLRGLLLRERWALPLWKDLDEFQAFGAALRSEMDRVKVPAQLPQAANAGNLLADYVLERKDLPALDGLRSRLVPASSGEWFLVEVTQGLSLKSQERIIAGDRARPLNELSRAAGSVESAWRRDIHLHVFLVGEKGPWTKKRGEYSQAIDQARARVARETVALYQQDPNLRNNLDKFLA